MSTNDQTPPPVPVRPLHRVLPRQLACVKCEHPHCLTCHRCHACVCGIYKRRRTTRGRGRRIKGV